MKHPVLVAGLWFMAMIVGTSALIGCSRQLTEAELKQQLAERQAQSEPKRMVGDITYKTVCLDGTLYYTSLVDTFDGQLGFKHSFWVIGGPVVTPGVSASNGPYKRCS